MNSDYPFLATQECQRCGAELIAAVEQVIGTPRATGGLMRVPLDVTFVWLQGCEHTSDLTDDDEGEYDDDDY